MCACVCGCVWWGGARGCSRHGVRAPSAPGALLERVPLAPRRSPSPRCVHTWCAAKVCAEDAKAHCNTTTTYFGYHNGSIIACLREAKSKLKAACKEEVFKTQVDAAYDYR